AASVYQLAMRDDMLPHFPAADMPPKPEPAGTTPAPAATTAPAGSSPAQPASGGAPPAAPEK
ncbi:MAG TPA: hypothetical protein VGN44_02450, partial [Candidatus Angelobacter sp.]